MAVGVEVGNGVLVLVEVGVAVFRSDPSGSWEPVSAMAPPGAICVVAPAKAPGAEEPTRNHAPSRISSKAPMERNLPEYMEDKACPFL